MLRWTRWTYNIFRSPRIVLKMLPREEPLYEKLRTRPESLELMKNWHIYIRGPFCKFSTRCYVQRRMMRTKWKRLNFSFALPNGPLCREGGWGKARRGENERRNWRDCVHVGREFRTWEFRPVARSRGTKRSDGLNVISRDTPAVSYYPRSRRRRTTERSSPPFSTPVNPFGLIPFYNWSALIINVLNSIYKRWLLE